MAFAKLYGTDDDQVLATREENEDGEPGIKITVQPRSELLRLCSTFLTYTTDERLEEAWAKLDESAARQVANGLHKMAEKFGE